MVPRTPVPKTPLFQSKIVAATPFLDRFRTGAGRRTLGLGLTLLIEALLVLVLLTLSPWIEPEVEEARTTVVSIRADTASQETAEQDRSEPEQRTEAQRQQPQPEQPSPQQPAEPAPVPPAPAPAAPQAVVPMDWQLRQSIPRPAAPARPVYGPADNRSVMMRDTERVGTAPNGEPMYAAAWYREPDDAMLRAYLSGARGPGYGLIACRTAPDFRVEDCVGLEEYPQGSNMNRSVLAAAWEFRVRPPRRGGQVLVGAWVRIRITYN